MPLESACPLQLATICFGYSHILMLSYTAPRLISEFGVEARAEVIIERMGHLTDRLAAFLDQEMSPENRESAILCLLESLSFQHNPAAMEVAFNAMDEYLQPQNGTAAEDATQPLLCSGKEAAAQAQMQPQGSSADSGEQLLKSSGAETGVQPLKSSSTIEDCSDRCKILCYHYYFTSDENSRRKAESILDHWISELSTESNRSAGKEAENHRVALAAMENNRSAGKEAENHRVALAATENNHPAGKTADRHLPADKGAGRSWILPLPKALERLAALAMYSDMVDAQRYENQLYRILEHYARDPQIARQVRFLVIVSHMGYFKKYHKLMEQITDHVMQGDLSMEQDKTQQCREQDLIQAVRFYVLAIYYHYRSPRT
ncbi:MAG: hypothetical protein LMBGKNDO_01687 [Bacteroidales bacterium]|nr:hypothetical protein [Bacteroidales bacterium]